jgi:hypothetical protein
MHYIDRIVLSNITANSLKRISLDKIVVIEKIIFNFLRDLIYDTKEIK